MSELRIGVDIGCGLRSNIHTNQGVDYAVCVDNNFETLKNNQQVRAG